MNKIIVDDTTNRRKRIKMFLKSRFSVLFEIIISHVSPEFKTYICSN